MKCSCSFLDDSDVAMQKRLAWRVILHFNGASKNLKAAWGCLGRRLKILQGCVAIFQRERWGPHSKKGGLIT